MLCIQKEIEWTVESKLKQKQLWASLADLNDENHQKHTMNLAMNTSIISKVAQDLMVDEINISL